MRLLAALAACEAACLGLHRQVLVAVPQVLFCVSQPSVTPGLNLCFAPPPPPAVSACCPLQWLHRAAAGGGSAGACCAAWRCRGAAAALAQQHQQLRRLHL
jgi:hypothetical protein